MTTEFLGLHQWEPDDSFLRTDFNEDFRKIDLGVREAKNAGERAMEAISPLRYNALQAALQGYYEGKGGSQKALLMDGFMDLKQVERVTGGGWDKAGMCLSMTAAAEVGSTGTPSNNYEFHGPGNWGYHKLVSTRCGTLNSISLVLDSYSAVSGTLRLSLVRWDTVNDRPTDSVVASGPAFTLPANLPSISVIPMNFRLETGIFGIRIDSTVRETDYFHINGSNTYAEDRRYYDANRNPTNYSFNFKLNLSTTSDRTATLHGKSTAAGFPFLRAEAYIRHSGGLSEFGLNYSGADHPFTRMEDRNTVTVQGVSCKETRFLLDLNQTASPSALSPRLTYTSGNVYDYGVLFY